MKKGLVWWFFWLLFFTVLAIYNLILVGCFQWRAPRAISWGLFTPRCAPLRVLAWGYRCFALRAMSLRDGTRCRTMTISTESNSFFVKIPMSRTVVIAIFLFMVFKNQKRKKSRLFAAWYDKFEKAFIFSSKNMDGMSENPHLAPYMSR